MKLIFDSLAEARDFLDEIDGEGGEGDGTAATGGTRRKRRTKAQMEADKGTGIPANQAFQAPPSNQPAPAAAAPPVTGFAAPTGQQGFPPAQPAAATVHPLVQPIIERTNAIVAGGQPLEQAVGWLRSVLGPEAAQANWEQICAAFLPKAPEATLKHIAGAIGVPA
jgi:hypothetical protein